MARSVLAGVSFFSDLAEDDLEQIAEHAVLESFMRGAVIRTVTEEVLVPLAADICQQINVADRTIEIDPPEGLLELNTTSRSRSAG